MHVDREQKKKVVKRLKKMDVVKFMCPFCRKCFKGVVVLKRHVENAHIPLSPFLRELCDGYLLNERIERSQRKECGINESFRDDDAVSPGRVQDADVSRTQSATSDVSVQTFGCSVCGLLLSSDQDALDKHAAEMHSATGGQQPCQTAPTISASNTNSSSVENHPVEQNIAGCRVFNSSSSVDANSSSFAVGANPNEKIGNDASRSANTLGEAQRAIIRGSGETETFQSVTYSTSDNEDIRIISINSLLPKSGVSTSEGAAPSATDDTFQDSSYSRSLRGNLSAIVENFMKSDQVSTLGAFPTNITVDWNDYQKRKYEDAQSSPGSRKCELVSGDNKSTFRPSDYIRKVLVNQCKICRGQFLFECAATVHVLKHAKKDLSASDGYKTG